MFEWYENEVRDVVARQTTPGLPPFPVAFYGSSSIRLWDTLSADFPDVPVVNLGFGGSTLAACAYFFDRLVPPVHPHALVLYAGDNDLGDGQSPDQVFASFCALQARMDDALGPDFPYLFLSIKPSPARLHLMNAIVETNSRIRNHIKNQLPCGFYVDVYSPMLDDNALPRTELFAPDGLHLSQAGYALWRDVVTQNRVGTF